MVPRPPRYWYERLLRELHQLATPSEQTRLWLSAGQNGAETGSLDESISVIFVECGIRVLSEEGELVDVTSPEFAEAIVALDELLYLLPKGLPPLVQVNHPAMTGIRAGALAAHDALLASMPE